MPRDIPWVSPTGQMTVRQVDDDGNLMEDKPLFGGKGDHDGDGKAGGAHAPLPEPEEPAPKRRKKT